MGLSGGYLRGGSNFPPLNQDPRCPRSQKFRLFRAPMRRTRRNHRNSRKVFGNWRTKKKSGEEKKGKILKVQGRRGSRVGGGGGVQGRVSGNRTPFVPFCLQWCVAFSPFLVSDRNLRVVATPLWLKCCAVNRRACAPCHPTW